MMNVELKMIKVSELVAGYFDSAETGVVGYHGKLNIRPPYQREFVYNQDKQRAVIESILKGFPLGLMYWIENDDGSLEILDGQQRTLSICKFIKQGQLNVNSGNKLHYYGSLPDSEKKKIQDYELRVCFCRGDDKDKLDWFEVINTGNVDLTPQEKRNAIYTGPWLTDAKKFFSNDKDNKALDRGEGYIKGDPIRQDILEKALRWFVDAPEAQADTIEDYMAKHRNDPNAIDLIAYYRTVMDWARDHFTVRRPCLKSIEWGLIYNQYKNQDLDPQKIEAEIMRILLDDEEINMDKTTEKGIYLYVITGEEKYLNFRSFSRTMRLSKYEQQQHKCAHCGTICKFEDMEGDHIQPWSKGGKTVYDNLQMLCKKCNASKSDNW